MFYNIYFEAKTPTCSWVLVQLPIRENPPLSYPPYPYIITPRIEPTTLPPFPIW